MAQNRYRHLGAFSDLVEFATEAEPAKRLLDPLTAREILGVDRDAEPIGPRVERTWSRCGIDGEEISWWVGYGPRTHAWLLRPSGVKAPLPGVLALHSHDGFKYYGREKIANGPEGIPAGVGDLRWELYAGAAFADELAREGFTVLVPDVLMWGSRRFPVETMGEPAPPLPDPPSVSAEEAHDGAGTMEDIHRYNAMAARHEHVVAKYCALLGASVPGLVAYEDRVAAAYLRSRADVRDGPIGCVGLSGGGCRSGLLQATCPQVGAAVVVGMMSTHRALLDRHVAPHTWMFFPPGLAGVGDWPDLVACRAPSPLLVQYLRDDRLFPAAGMEAAHEHLTESYRCAGAPHAYVGEFYPGPHRFDRSMQESAFDYLTRWLAEC